jgi:hypothetical protein
MHLFTPLPRSVPRCNRPVTLVIALVAAAAAASRLAAGPFTATFATPVIDRWVYPLGSTPGTETFTRLFGAFDNPIFDNRDGQMYVLYNTSAQVTPGLPAASYHVTAASVTIQNTEDDAYIYDNTVDPYGVFLASTDPDFTADLDEGQPIELFGAGFRNGFSAATFQETTPYTTAADPLQQGVRSVFAAGFDARGELADVSLSVDQRFTPQPWAVGMIAGLAPGSPVPIDSQTVLTLNLADPRIEAYLAQGLADGRVPLTITSLNIVEFMGGSFPKIYTKEHPLAQFGIVAAATLQLTVEIIDAVLGDLDGDSDVDGFDLATLLGAWGACADPTPGNCPADLDGNGTVNGFDLATLLAAWNPS